ncbi:MAG: RidA family protein [Planctomycetota bacterium]
MTAFRQTLGFCAPILGVLLAACAATEDNRRSTPAEPQAFPSTTGSNAPFSPAVLVRDTLYVAGHLGIDAATGAPPADPAAEANLLLDGFAATLARADLTMDDLVQVQVFCTDVALYDVWNRVYRTRFQGPFPARAFVGSGPLVRGARFEMLGIAVRSTDH